MNPLGLVCDVQVKPIVCMIGIWYVIDESDSVAITGRQFEINELTSAFRRFHKNYVRNALMTSLIDAVDFIRNSGQLQEGSYMYSSILRSVHAQNLVTLIL